VLDHRAYLGEHGSLAARRARQQQDWMWAMVDASLTDGVRRSPSVLAERERLEAAVREGGLSAVEGTARVLELYAQDLRAQGAPSLADRG